MLGELIIFADSRYNKEYEIHSKTDSIVHWRRDYR